MSSGSITGSIPSATYGLLGPGLPLAFFAFIIAFSNIAFFAFIAIRIANPSFIRNVRDDQGNYVSITFWRSVWVSLIIALIPSLLIAGLTFYLTAETTKASATIVEKVLPSAVKTVEGVGEKVVPAVAPLAAGALLL